MTFLTVFILIDFLIPVYKVKTSIVALRPGTSEVIRPKNNEVICPDNYAYLVGNEGYVRCEDFDRYFADKKNMGHLILTHSVTSQKGNSK
jgi:hypothetical protein